MWSFVIAFIGIVYYGIRIALESGEKEANDRHLKNSKAIQDKITATLDEEMELREDMRNRGKREGKLLHHIESELAEIFGSGWRQEIYEYPFEETTCISQPWGIVFHLLLAKRGKVYVFNRDGYELDGMSDIQRKHVIKLCEIIERNIQINYPELRLIFHPGHFTEIDSRGLHTGYREELYMGKIEWEHNLPVRNKKYNPPTRRLW